MTSTEPSVTLVVLDLLGIAVFAVPLAIGQGHWGWALAYGALFGICVFSAYDFTNLATLRDWPVALTFVDLDRKSTRLNSSH